MRSVILLAAVAAVGAGPRYHLNLARYFYPTPGVEHTRRVALLAEVDGFLETPASSLDTPSAFSGWLATYDSLSKRLNRHDLYVYLRAEEDTNDHADAAADDALEAEMTRMDSVAESILRQLGAEKLHGYIAADATLAPYRYFIDSMLERAAHRPTPATAGAPLLPPALDSLTASYKSLSNRLLTAGGGQRGTPEAAFAARWNPYVANEDRFASLLLSIVRLNDDEARRQGFSGAPAAAYSGDRLTAPEVAGALQAARESDGYKRYVAVLSAAASRRLHVAATALHAWDLDQADSYAPMKVPFPAALPLILAAERPMGAAYAGQYARLFDPRSGRLEWCRAAACDKTGFSVGYAGLVSGVFYGSYTGDVNSMRAVAHEAGHAVHREFMAENQPLAVYNAGPKFMLESCAIFNEFLFLDHLYRTAHTPAARAYYLNRFLDDATFQVWGSARETDLEQSIYSAAARGELHGAADLDALTLRVFARYTPRPSLDPRLKVYWARNRLFFTDPVYDVNYLFAGLLALEYVQRLDEDPAGFPTRYVALLENGFTDSPQVLEKKFLGIDLDDTQGLVRNADDLIARRAHVLERLYDVRDGGAGSGPP